MQTATKSELKSIAQDLRNDVANTSEAVKKDLRVIANNAGHKVRDILTTAKEEISHVSDSVNKQIHERPVQSSLIALGIGVVLGALLRR